MASSVIILIELLGVSFELRNCFFSFAVGRRGTTSLAYFFRTTRSTCTLDNFTFQEVIDIFFNLARGGVTHEDNLAFGVNEEHMRHTINSVFFVGSAACSSDVVVLDILPAFALDVVLDSASIVVDG